MHIAMGAWIYIHPRMSVYHNDNTGVHKIRCISSTFMGWNAELCKNVSRYEVFRKFITNTLYYLAFNVPISVIGSLLLAILVNNNLPGMNGFKTALYIPSITSGIAMAMLWMWIFDPGSGLVNTFLRNMGMSNVPMWFQSASMVKPTMIIVKIVEIGGARMIRTSRNSNFLI